MTQSQNEFQRDCALRSLAAAEALARSDQTGMKAVMAETGPELESMLLAAIETAAMLIQGFSPDEIRSQILTADYTQEPSRD